MRVDTSAWSEFRIGDLFELYKGTRLTKANMIEGDIRFVSAANVNNGVTAHIGNNERIHSEGTITVCYNGNGGTGKAFYQDKPYWASDDVHVLYPKFHLPKSFGDVEWTGLNATVGLFLAAAIEKVGRQKYGFTDKWKLDNMREDKIELPVGKDGTPDWEYIERYMMSVLQDTSPIATMLKRTGNNRRIAIANFDSWRTFKIDELFEISRPRPRSQLSYREGDVPFVASGNTNNGVVKRCQPLDEEKPDNGNCITVSPLDGTAFYQPSSFLGRGGAGSAILILRNEHLNQWTGLFLASCITCSLSKYSYIDQLNSSSIASESIRIPTTSDGKPSWDYMESFMRNAMDEAESKLTILSSAIRE